MKETPNTFKTVDMLTQPEGEYVNQKTISLVKVCGQKAIEIRNKGLSAEVKSSKEDIVTKGDTEITEILKSELSKTFPDINYLDEETSSTHELKSFTGKFFAVIDPIDGTSNYFNNNENWGVSVGFVNNGEIIGGIIYQPDLNKMYCCEKGKGAFLNGQRLSTSKQKTLNGSVPYFDFPYPKDKDEYELTQKFIDRLPQLLQTEKPIKLGSQVIEIMKVAEGNADLFFMFKTKPWDVAAAISIVSEAGGLYTNSSGESYSLFEEDIVISNGQIDLNPFFETVYKTRVE